MVLGRKKRRICTNFPPVIAVVVPNEIIAYCTTELKLESADTYKLLQELKNLILMLLYQDISDPKRIYSLFPDDFHKNLRELLSKILAESMPKWKASAINRQVSLPRLEDFDWRVDLKVSSDTINRMAMPTCIMQLKIQQNQEETKLLPPQQCINLELSKETIDTMLDGLGKIRDQLSSVAENEIHAKSS
ncbi:uncharacterized protein TRIADDRAFT_51748 [Trichoplax adhaerens]|uniref:COMM domain-containing protein n=1 Tax=Trichoplax adhaerens TaxID=10228 RepID=B3RKS6_TRIAD|nr:hypothetical protein TRIADDRAFT_51748 [Trichoplax adhaerens]EDV29431.1 hypothetical protein TRIADDRAFT_51748 [Trichoplax adhaerens]|eukprot:XP_002108633.1 hypothetical protein TRIADDRAFT_51748 [Trichoplax adhaerens]